MAAGSTLYRLYWKTPRSLQTVHWQSWWLCWKINLSSACLSIFYLDRLCSKRSDHCGILCMLERAREDRLTVVVSEWSARSIFESFVRPLPSPATCLVSCGKPAPDCAVDWLLSALEPINCTSGKLFDWWQVRQAVAPASTVNQSIKARLYGAIGYVRVIPLVVARSCIDVGS